MESSQHGRKRECAESCLDFLVIEAVDLYRRAQSGPPASTALDAIGFRVGRQLAER